MAQLGLLLAIITLLHLAVAVHCNEPSGFYFILQWLPSYCNQKGTHCCYPPTGKPSADFKIYGLWPYGNGGSALQNCPGASFDVAPLKSIESMLQKQWPSFTCPQIGRKYWLHEWNKHGTCSKSILDELAYFHAALNLKSNIDIFQALGKVRIIPNNQFYPLENIKAAITHVVGFQPFIFCNKDAQGNSQIWQVLMCVDKSGTKFVKCTGNPKGQCTSSSIKFPSY